jgi:hypothetical protein
MPKIKFGTSDAGFSISYEKERASLELWGFWNKELADAFVRKIIEAKPAPKFNHLEVNISTFKPQRFEGQEAFRALIVSSQTNNVNVLVVAGDNTLTKIQLKRVLRETGATNWSFNETSPT